MNHQMNQMNQVVVCTRRLGQVVCFAFCDREGYAMQLCRIVAKGGIWEYARASIR